MYSGDKVVNVSKLVDDMPFTRLQLIVVSLCALVGFLDGADTQSIGVAAPFLAKAMGMKIGSFGPVFAASQLGAAIGALTFGSLADRFGRKPMLIVAIVTFAVFTIMTVEVATLPLLIAVRFLAGIGLGGATPCFLALTSDYSPRKQRGMIATIIWSAYPLGAAFGSFMNAYILSNFGWTSIFYIGGLLPLCVSVLLLFMLPESVQYLAGRRDGANDQIRKILARMGKTFDAQVQFVAEGKKMTGAPIRHLFAERRGIFTLLLWATFFLAFATTNVMVMWTPTLLRSNGLEPAATAIVLAFFNLGAFVGMASSGRLIERFGAAQALIPAFLGGAISIAVLGGATTTMMAATVGTVLGLTIGVGGAGAIAVATMFYPSAIRSTGVGMGMSSARFGQFISPLLIGGLVTAGVATRNILAAAALFPVLAAVIVVLMWLREWRSPAAPTAVPETL
jgi:AAHS family 4-hydroxybenzoate transporter-like MFS transporter